MKKLFSLSSSASSIRQRRGFTLVEVVLALGIVAFAFVPILGMLSVGLGSFNQAIDSTVEAQIAQRIFAEAQQVPFASLSNIEGPSFYNQEGGTISESGVGATGIVYYAIVTVSQSAIVAGNDYAKSISIEISKNRDVESARQTAPKQITNFTLVLGNTGT